MGGLARCRTMHEIAVTSMVLQDFGRTEQHSDIAERYLLHDVVINYKDAVEYQKNCDALGYEPFADGEMWSMKADRDAIIARFGPRFDQPYGWAATAIGNAVPKFTDLEAAAELSRLRSHYKWACHENHADAKGARMNTSTATTSPSVSGPLDIGLADPGHMAAISLHQITVALLLSHNDVGPSDLPVPPWHMLHSNRRLAHRSNPLHLRPGRARGGVTGCVSPLLGRWRTSGGSRCWTRAR